MWAGEEEEVTDGIFTTIYKNNTWGGVSRSGKGSDLENTGVIAAELERILSKYRIWSMLDIPCGDFSWMQRVNLEDRAYFGADIVAALIADNRERYYDRERDVNFEVLDLREDSLPVVDLVFCRDGMVHLPNRMVWDCLRNIIGSGSRYLMATTFPDHANRDIAEGGWRPINLERPPFSFPPPLEFVFENYTGDNGRFTDKGMGLWEISSLMRVHE